VRDRRGHRGMAATRAGPGGRRVRPDGAGARRSDRRRGLCAQFAAAAGAVSGGRMIGVGLIGCGNIAETYLRLAPRFRGFEFRAVADIDPGAAAARARAFGLPAATVAEVLDAATIDIVVNLTVPSAHFGVSSAILLAGKHVYSEKPLTLTLYEAR